MILASTPTDTPVVEPVVLGVTVVVVLVALRHFAARRVAAGQGRYAWLMFLPMVMGAVVILLAGLQMVPAEPVAGAALDHRGWPLPGDQCCASWRVSLAR